VSTKAGPIREACVVVADLAAARARLAAALGWSRGSAPTGFDTARAALWGMPSLAGAPCCVLAPPSGQGGAIRLIQHPVGPGSASAAARGIGPRSVRAGSEPFRRVGWSAIELQVADSSAAVRRAESAGLRVLAEPRTIGDGGSLPIRAGQVADADGLVLYLTQILGEVAGFELPTVRGDTDGVFIAVLSANDLDHARGIVERHLNTTRASDRYSPIGVVNATLGLPPDTKHRISSQQLSGANLVEIDQLDITHDPPDASWDPPWTGVVAVCVQADVAAPVVWRPSGRAVLELVPGSAAPAAAGHSGIATQT
jgi:hypothetical protein